MTTERPTITPLTDEQAQDTIASFITETPAESTAVPAASVPDPTAPPPETLDAIRTEYGEAGVTAAKELWGQHRTAVAAHQEHLAKEHAKLADAIPGWEDPVARAQLVRELRAYGASQGYDDEALNRVDDSRAVILAYHAMHRGKELARGTFAPMPSRAAPKSTGRSAAVRDAYARLQARHFQRDAVEVIKGLLPD